MDRPAWQRLAINLASTPAGAWFYINIAPTIDRLLLPLTRGKISTAVIFPVVIVDTVGAKTSRIHPTPLVTARDGDRLVLIASRGGDTRNPGWYHNLRAHAEVTAHFQGVSRRYTAREVDGTERDRLWQLAASAYPGYNTYQARTRRRIPVIVLEPTVG